jgi:PRTRC genetic system protein B
MKIITSEFSQFYSPNMALLVYENKFDGRDVRVESYDIDKKGRPVNAHPLTVNESKALAKALATGPDMRTGFLHHKGIVHANLLYVDLEQAFAVWYTPARQVELLFKKELTIPNGKAHVPPLVWKAHHNQLEVFALKEAERPTEKTPLFHAPFFNLYADGRVCMGTVDIEIDEDCSLPDFMALWEDYFWKSYFSHSIGGLTPITGNLVGLWQNLVSQPQTPFPVEVLKRNGKTVKDLIV